MKQLMPELLVGMQQLCKHLRKCQNTAAAGMMRLFVDAA
jgi:hypothetical protein